MNKSLNLVSALAVLLLAGCATHYRFADDAKNGDYQVSASEKELRFSRGRTSLVFTPNSAEARIDGRIRLIMPWVVKHEKGDFIIEKRLLERIVEPLLSKRMLDTDTVVIDAGHGGDQPGAVGAVYKEKDLNLAVARLLKGELEKRGLKVVMTRETDLSLPLRDRVRIADGSKSRLFISVHHNAAHSRDARGYSVYAPRNCSNYPGESVVLAACVQRELLKLPQVLDRGVNFADFKVLYSNMPAVLVELGFISNQEEELIIGAPSRQKIEAAAIAEGVVRYLRRAGETRK